MNDVKIISEEEAGKMNPKLTFDSRPPRASRNAMLQHFLAKKSKSIDQCLMIQLLF